MAPAAPAHNQGSAWPWLSQADFCKCILLPPPTTGMLPALGAPRNTCWGSTHFSGLRAWASLYRYTRLRKCTQNWSRTVRMVYRLKILGRGRSWDRVLRGCSGGGGAKRWMGIKAQRAFRRPGAGQSPHPEATGQHQPPEPGLPVDSAGAQAVPLERVSVDTCPAPQSSPSVTRGP